MKSPKEDMQVMKAIKIYLEKNNLVLCDNAEYEWGIDHVAVYAEGVKVLIVGLPPLSNYSVRKADYADEHLLPRKSIAI